MAEPTDKKREKIEVQCIVIIARSCETAVVEMNDYTELIKREYKCRRRTAMIQCMRKGVQDIYNTHPPKS
jgi:hypothetical protein